jgi:hypothetical protein
MSVYYSKIIFSTNNTYKTYNAYNNYYKYYTYNTYYTYYTYNIDNTYNITNTCTTDITYTFYITLKVITPTSSAVAEDSSTKSTSSNLPNMIQHFYFSFYGHTSSVGKQIFESFLFDRLIVSQFFIYK